MGHLAVEFFSEMCYAILAACLQAKCTFETFRYHKFTAKAGLMENFLVSIKLPALIGAIVVLPFMLLEWINRREFQEGYPFPLFIMLWLLTVIFFFFLAPIVQKVKLKENLLAHPINLLLRLSLLGFSAWLWVAIVIDQMPCFLGVPLCD